ncbi:MAG: hypothetical protein JJT94_04600 [Bernardetiaceae bacterium]|nr:hypothetical protein [Bernardetiaceae bacterium]
MGDLIYYEGPLLSHFQDENQNDTHFFYRWVDNDQKANRWLVFKSSNQDLIKFFNSQFSELDLIAQNNTLTFLDLDDKLNPMGIYMTAFEDVPEDYLPSPKTFFEANRYEPYALELKAKLEDALQKENLMLQLFDKVLHLEKEHKENAKILSEIKKILKKSHITSTLNA